MEVGQGDLTQLIPRPAIGHELEPDALIVHSHRLLS
jgi:hypothetical protein